ncbi:hypothetical protein B9Z35_03455 [Limnohabitans sp. Jir61]|nr:hypothetical protein B9Z35_03455 [Limnohabitans sp. Jir61]
MFSVQMKVIFRSAQKTVLAVNLLLLPVGWAFAGSIPSECEFNKTLGLHPHMKQICLNPVLIEKAKAIDFAFQQLKVFRSTVELNDLQKLKKLNINNLRSCSLLPNSEAEVCTSNWLNELVKTMDATAQKNSIRIDFKRDEFEVSKAVQKTYDLAALDALNARDKCVKSAIVKMDDGLSGADVIAESVTQACRSKINEAFDAYITSVLSKSNINQSLFLDDANPNVGKELNKQDWGGKSHIIPEVLEYRSILRDKSNRGNKKESSKSPPKSS